MMTKQLNFQSWSHCQHPLIIAASGGGGHIIAAESLIEKLNHPLESLTYHHAPTPSPQPQKLSLEHFIILATKLYHTALLKPLLSRFFPIQLPRTEELLQEMRTLLKKNTQPKPYLDFTLDILPNGYAFIALFNLMQQQDHPSSLYHITHHQTFLDRIYQKTIAIKFYQVLIQAVKQGQAYDQILMTQPIGIVGICQALNRYNRHKTDLEQHYQIKIPTLRLHLFVTDIPYHSAIHFIRPLERLGFLHKQHLHIHLMDLNNQNYLLEKKHADQITRYNPQTMPIIRQAFTQSCTQLKQPITFIKPPKHHKIITLMLSSANGPIIIDYLKQLIPVPEQHILIIGKITQQLTQYIQQYPSQIQQRIRVLGYLTAQELAYVLKRSHFIIIKGGGLSLMEIAPCKLQKNCLILIHQAKSIITTTPAQRGLCWEYGNVSWFLNYCKVHHKNAELTSPQTLIKQIPRFKKINQEIIE